MNQKVSRSNKKHDKMINSLLNSPLNSDVMKHKENYAKSQYHTHVINIQKQQNRILHYKERKAIFKSYVK